MFQLLWNAEKDHKAYDNTVQLAGSWGADHHNPSAVPKACKVPYADMKPECNPEMYGKH
eukprot:CAMPEP_0179406118 /NCGR_PEP_ID=MMETSP0799-20121207/700_1 /TAXON_ID=46947 /ORGANISM="Geminigera cryophila, Strain CCMP2564" /LENGTH=58 /DNA_ID=CAMNT_0021177113 /DNA_START=19 /DNA_END=195 /DNA_ORIENTATION=+